MPVAVEARIQPGELLTDSGQDHGAMKALGLGGLFYRAGSGTARVTASGGQDASLALEGARWLAPCWDALRVSGANPLEVAPGPRPSPRRWPREPNDRPPPGPHQLALRREHSTPTAQDRWPWVFMGATADLQHPRTGLSRVRTAAACGPGHGERAPVGSTDRMEAGRGPPRIT